MIKIGNKQDVIIIGTMIFIIVALATIVISIFGRLFNHNHNFLKKLKSARIDYKKNGSFICSNSGKILNIIAIVIIIFGSAIYFFAINNVFMSIFMLITMVILTIAILKTPSIIKLENNFLIILNRNQQINYDINNIKDIKYSIRSAGKSSYMTIYIKENEKYEEYSIKQQIFTDVEILIYLIVFIKNNELEKIDNIAPNDIKELKRIYNIKYNFELVK